MHTFDSLRSLTLPQPHSAFIALLSILPQVKLHTGIQWMVFIFCSVLSVDVWIFRSWLVIRFHRWFASNLSKNCFGKARKRKESKRRGGNDREKTQPKLLLANEWETFSSFHFEKIFLLLQGAVSCNSCEKNENKNGWKQKLTSNERKKRMTWISSVLPRTCYYERCLVSIIFCLPLFWLYSSTFHATFRCRRFFFSLFL